MIVTNCKDCKTNCVYRGKDNEARCGSFVGTVTNADRIRAWNDHELAETIANFVSEIDNGDVRYSDDPNDWLKWLQQPVEE